MPTAAIYTLGCRANQYDSESLLAPFLENGYERAPEFSRADIHIVNTCTVTNRGESKSRRLIRKIIKLGRGSVIVTGCSAQQDAEAMLALGANLVVDNVHKYDLYKYVQNLKKNPDARLICGDIGKVRQFKQPPISSFGEKSRAHLKIQDGCNNRCTYCIIPSVRGATRSLDPASVLSQAEALIGNGYREIVVTGIHVGQYRYGSTEFSTLLKTLLELPGKFRLRLSAIEPREITPDLLALFGLYPEKLCRHLHVAIQSASDSILERMRRHYNRAYLEKLFTGVFKLKGGFGVGIDAIVGFPGESDEEFGATLAFIDQFPLSYGHVFRFSPKPGTPAASFGRQVPDSVKKQRSQILRNALTVKQAAFMQAQNGSTQQCLFESETEGHTANYTRIKLEKGKARPGALENIRFLKSFSRLKGEKFPVQAAELVE